MGSHWFVLNPVWRCPRKQLQHVVCLVKAPLAFGRQQPFFPTYVIHANSVHKKYS